MYDFSAGNISKGFSKKICSIKNCIFTFLNSIDNNLSLISLYITTSTSPPILSIISLIVFLSATIPPMLSLIIIRAVNCLYD